MEQIALAIVDDTPEVLKARLKREWEVIEARKEAGEVDYDVYRAQTLITYIGRGLTQNEVAICVGINQGWLHQLLRYGRFVTFNNANALLKPIPEGRFRRYWKETADKTVMMQFVGKGTKKNEAARLAYEQEVFQRIQEKLMRDQQEPSEQRKGTNMATRQVTKKILAQFSDGKFHLLCDIATAVEADMAVVRGICDRVVTHGIFQTLGERRPAPPAQGSFTYRFVKGGNKKVDKVVLDKETKPLWDDLETLVNGHRVDFTQQAIKEWAARYQKTVDRVAR
jgi:hypothetical protein